MTKMISSKVTLIVVFVMIMWTCSDQEVCHDVAVVGGGLVGTYAVWRLRKQRISVGLYELSNRLGGRLYTHYFQHAPDIPIELGAMRFSPEDHPLLYRTVNEVGLKTRKFTGQDNDSDKALYFLRGKHLRDKDFIENSVPYNLRPHESGGIQKIYRHLTRKTNFSGNALLLNKELHYLVSDDGVKLTDQTSQEFFRKYLSVEAVEIISNIYKFSQYNRTAASVFPMLVPDNMLISNNMSTISGGMQRLPEQLVKQFLSASQKHSLKLDHQLVNITKNARNMFTLGFIKTRTAAGKTVPTSEDIVVCSRRVILAFPSTALRKINSEILHRKHILSNLNSVNSHFCVKLFLAYAFPWWRKRQYNVQSRCWTSNSYSCLRGSQTENYSYCGDTDPRGRICPNLKSDLPIDMTLDYGSSDKSGTAILLAAYSTNEIWRYLQKKGDNIGQGYHSVSKEVIQRAHMHLARLYNIPFQDIPFPMDGIVSHWDAYPYGAAFITSKKGVDWETVWKTIHKPSAIDDLFVASGSYWKRMSDAWSEYSLEAIKEIIDIYF